MHLYSAKHQLRQQSVLIGYDVSKLHMSTTACQTGLRADASSSEIFGRGSWGGVTLFTCSMVCTSLTWAASGKECQLTLHLASSAGKAGGRGLCVDGAALSPHQGQAHGAGGGDERGYPAADLCGGVCRGAAHVHGLHSGQHQHQRLDSLCPGVTLSVCVSNA